MSFEVTFDQPWLESIEEPATPTGVPQYWEVSIAGRTYVLDTSFEPYRRDAFRHRSIQAQRESIDLTNVPGEGCVDEETEILTQRGWITQDDLEVGDIALTINTETQMSEWQPVQEICRWPERHRRLLSMEGKQHSSLTTLDHRWPVRYRPWHKPKAIRIRRSNELNTADSLITTAPCVTLPTEAKYTDDFVELVAWFWTEGNITLDHRNEKPRRVTVSQVKHVHPYETARIRACFTRLFGPGGDGMPWYEYVGKNGGHLFNIRRGYFNELLDVCQDGKVVRPSFLSALTMAQLELFIDVSILGDGWIVNGKSRCLGQRKKAMNDSFHMACVLAGKRAHMRLNPTKRGDMWDVSLSEGNRPDLSPHANLRQANGFSIEEVDHYGMVWCPRVENGTFMARRHGKCYFTGNTVNTEGLWRRGAIDWHLGAGQPWQDRKGSDDARFSTSKGIDPWMQWEASLLSDTTHLLTISGNGQVLQVGKYVYVLDESAQTLKFSSNLTSWTSVTFTSPPYTPVLNMMATNGYDLWISDSASTIGTALWHTTAGATSASSYSTSGGCTGVWWVGDRLMAAGLDSTIYNVLASGSLTQTVGGIAQALWTHPNSNFRWSTACSGSSQIYLGGYDLGEGLPLQSLVYRTTIETTGTALTIPVQALPMEGGEYCTSLYGYLNFVFVGSNLGLRMCRTIAAYDPTGNEGDLEAGPLIPGLFPPGPVTWPVQAMVGSNRFLYFGWSDYDDESTGLGRCDLSTFIDTQAPAFTSDLMVGGSGYVTSMDWCNINQQPIFVVEGRGVYTGSGTPVESGTITSGYITYGIPDDKIVMAGDIGTITPQSGTVYMGLAADGAGIGTVGSQASSASGGTPTQSVFSIGQIRGEVYTVQMTLVRDAVTGESPTLHRWTLKALPAITAGTTISVVLRMWNVDDVDGQDYYFDPYVEKAFLENLRTTQTVFTYVEGPYSALCTVDEIDWLPEKAQDATTEGGFHGNLICYLKTWDT